jgi:hypothetical protein
MAKNLAERFDELVDEVRRNPGTHEAWFLFVSGEFADIVRAAPIPPTDDIDRDLLALFSCLDTKTEPQQELEPRKPTWRELPPLL